MEIKELDKYNYQVIKELRRKRPTLYTNLKRVSRSGMFRLIDVFYIDNNTPINLNWLISELGLYTKDKQTGSLRVSGCGMDMGFAVVFDFSRKIFPKGFKIRKGDYNRNARNGMKPTEKGYNYDTDGGYALDQKWL